MHESVNRDVLVISLFHKRVLTMRREENPTRCQCMLYCIYDMLKMFRALLYPLSGALD